MKSWVPKKLDEVCELITCGVAARPQYVDIGIPFLSAKNIKDGQIIWNGYNCISEKTHKELTKNNKPLLGDILYTRVGSYGEAAVIEDDYEFSVFVSLTLIKVDKRVLNNYFLKHYLNSDFVKRLAKKSISGSGVGNLNVGTVREFPILLPTLHEQQRIVSILDEAFATIAKAKKNAEQNLRNAKELFESYLQGVFENKGADWQVKIFEEVCNLIGGNQPSKDDFIYEPKEGYIRLIQVRDYRTDKYITYIPKDKARRFCSENDIMIGRYGPPIFGIFKGLEGAYNVALMKAEVNTKICNQDYFFWFLKTNKLRVFVEKSSKRAAGQDGIRKELLDKYPVPLPKSLEVQQNIVQKLDALFAKTKKLESNYQQKISDLEELKKSVLQKAFSGELKIDKISIP